MREIEIVVPSEADGKKLKHFLRGSCEISSGILTKLKWIYNGITVNGEHSYVTRILKTGDVIHLKLPEAETDVEPAYGNIEIVYEDDDVYVVNKPRGMPIHPSAGHDCDSLANYLCGYFKNRNLPFAFHPIYRLDRNTSGLIVIGKHSLSASLLAFAVNKTYYAVCEGVLTGEGTIDAPIRLKNEHTIEREVGGGEGSQEAVTHYKAIKHANNHTLLQIKLDTGRTHQIRVHLSHIGHPLAGDDMYGGGRQIIKRQALHCGDVEFISPVTKVKIQLSQPLPEDIQQIMR